MIVKHLYNWTFLTNWGVLMANIYLYHLDREIHSLFGLDDPRQYKYTKVYNESELILKLAILLCDGKIILPASNFFESNLGFNLLKRMDLSSHTDEVLFSLCSSSYNLSEFLEKKNKEHADNINKPEYHYQEFSNNNKLKIPGHMEKRNSSASEDIKRAWVTEDKLINLAKIIHDNFPQAYKPGELEQLMSDIPNLLGERAFISGYITPFFRSEISDSKRLDNAINCFITKEYIRSFLEEYKAAYISDIELFQAELVLPTDDCFQHYSYRYYKKKLLESSYKGESAWKYLTICNKYDLLLFKNSDCWKRIIYNQPKIYSVMPSGATLLDKSTEAGKSMKTNTTALDSFNTSFNLLIIAIAPGWGYTNGGINVFNTEMCLGMVEVFAKTNISVICIAPNIPANDITEAKTKGLELISIDGDSFDSDSIIKELTKRPDIGNGKIAFIGHDIYTGHISNECRNHFEGSISAVVHHMSYGTYYPLVNTDDQETSKKESKQKTVLTDANIIFANGPVLKDSASDIVNDRIKVIEVLPGISNVETRSKHPNSFKVVTCGRVEPANGTKLNNSIIKQVYLSVAAWASFVDTYIKSPDVESTMKIYGKQRDGYEVIDDIDKIFSDNCKALHVCSVVEYENDRNKLLSDLSSFSLSMMLSLREGFGLTALEAISAGVPVIISERSGLYLALKKRRLDSYIQHVYVEGKKEFPFFTDKDKENVKDKIYYVYQHQEEEKNNTLDLKKLLEESGFTWTECGKTVVNEILQLY